MLVQRVGCLEIQPAYIAKLKPRRAWQWCARAVRGAHMSLTAVQRRAVLLVRLGTPERLGMNKNAAGYTSQRHAAEPQHQHNRNPRWIRLSYATYKWCVSHPADILALMHHTRRNRRRRVAELTYNNCPIRRFTLSSPRAREVLRDALPSRMHCARLPKGSCR